MNRRGFLKATTGIAAGAVAPAPAGGSLAGGQLASSIIRTVEHLNAQRELNRCYYWLFCHPRQFRDILDIEARERWALAYRAFRVASRERFIEYDPRAVLRDFGGSKSGLLAGEIGRVDGVTFIQTV